MILLLHGAIGSSKQLDPLKSLLEKEFDVHTLNFSGHGGNSLPDKFSIDLFAKDVLTWMEQRNVASVDLFGYSMGGYVGLYLARFFPGKVNRLFTLATKLNWSLESARAEGEMLNADKISEKLPGFARDLQERHSPANWKQVLQMTKEMMLNMGENNVLIDEDFRKINIPVTLSVGDSDKMVSQEETERVSKLIPNGKFLVIENTKHPIEAVNLNVLAEKIIKNFII